MTPYTAPGPTRAELDATSGPVVAQFGTNWCGICRAADPVIEQAFAGHAGVQRFKIEDGPGRPTGRSFRVKLWPTLVFLVDGKEVGRLVRPNHAADVTKALETLG